MPPPERKLEIGVMEPHTFISIFSFLQLFVQYGIYLLSTLLYNFLMELIEDPKKSLREDPELKRIARDMYFAGIYPSEIADELEIDFDDLGVHVFGSDGTGESRNCWAYQLKQRRDMGTLAVAGAYVRQKPIIMKQTEAKMMKMVNDSIDSHMKEGKLLDIDEIGKVVSTVEKIDKITRLEEGKATSHTALDVSTFSSQREIMDYVKKNSPSAHPDVEAEFREIASSQGVESKAAIYREEEEQDEDDTGDTEE